MKKPRNTFCSLVLFILLNSVVINAYSISISTRRLYLDPNNNSTSIRVHNTDPVMQNCEVEIRDVVINKLGNIELVNNDVVTTNSAKPLVRLAPRRFTLESQEPQMVKVLYRRKPGLDSGEYQGVLAIKCTEEKENSNLPVTIIPALIHNVPIIVRTGKLAIQAEFVSTTINGNTLQVELKIQGKRSVTGDITVINSVSGDVIYERKNISIYAQQPVKKLTLPLGEYSNTPLLLKFAEDSNFGGDLTIQQQVK
jgi:P pilus assembly chaperone PapD